MLTCLGQEKAVPFRSHFGKNVCRTRVVDGEGHPVPHHSERPSGNGELNLGCEIGGVSGIGRSRPEVLYLASRGPGNVERRTGVVGPWSKEKRVVDGARFG